MERIYQILVLGSCSYDWRVQFALHRTAADGDGVIEYPLSLPYLEVHLEEAEYQEESLHLRLNVPMDAMKTSRHYERMVPAASAFVYLFCGSLERFWTVDYPHLLKASNKFNRPFFAFIQMDAPEMADDEERRQSLIKHQLDIYTRTKSSDFLFFQWQSHRHSAAIWTQIIRQVRYQWGIIKRKN